MEKINGIIVEYREYAKISTFYFKFIFQTYDRKYLIYVAAHGSNTRGRDVCTPNNNIKNYSFVDSRNSNLVELHRILVLSFWLQPKKKRNALKLSAVKFDSQLIVEI